MAAPAFAEEMDYDTVGKLGVGLGFGSMSTLDQPLNAQLVSRPAWLLNPSLEMAIVPVWLLTLESEIRSVTYEQPTGATLVQDPSVLASVSGGFHFRTRVFEIGVLGGIGQSAFVSSAPTSSYVTVQNLTLPHVGGRLSYNGRWGKTTYFKFEGTYWRDVPIRNDRGSLQVTKNQRLMFNTHWGLNSWSPFLRLTAGFGLNLTESSIGRQSSLMMTIGISIGNIWGTRIPVTR